MNIHGKLENYRKKHKMIKYGYLLIGKLLCILCAVSNFTITCISFYKHLTLTNDLGFLLCKLVIILVLLTLDGISNTERENAGTLKKIYHLYIVMHRRRKLLSRVRLFETPCTVKSMEFSRPEC